MFRCITAHQFKKAEKTKISYKNDELPGKRVKDTKGWRIKLRVKWTILVVVLIFHACGKELKFSK